jgi:microcystin-dependent protein
MKQLTYGASLLLVLLFCTTPRQAVAQAEPFLGQIALFAFDFCPVGWAPANGAIMSIQQNTALFSLLGTNFGGDGVTTFQLPNWGQIRTANGPLTPCIAVAGVFPSRN